MAASLHYPSPVGLRAAIETLDVPARRSGASWLPVLLVVASEAEAGRTIAVPGSALHAVPNSVIRAQLAAWFGVDGQPGLPFFFPMPVPGGQVPHWRTDSVLAGSTMSALVRRGWVQGAEDLQEERGNGYPLDLPADWPQVVASAIGDPKVDEVDRRGLDLAALGVWFARAEGVEADGVPARDALIDLALARLGLPANHGLTSTTPPVLDSTGSYTPDPSHFQDAPLSEELLLEALRAIAPPPATAGVEADLPPPDQVVRTTLTPPDPPLELDDRVRRMLRLNVASGRAVLLVGPPGTGKTSLVAEMQHELTHDALAAARYGLSQAPAGIKPVTPDDDWNSQTLIGGLTLDEHDKLRFRPGYVLEAIRADEWLLLDEANRGDLDKIFGGLLTWLSGQRVVIGRASTHPDAPSVVLEWSDETFCEVIGYDRLAGGQEPGNGDKDQEGGDTPIVFRAGTDWRLLGTYNPVDAQRVFKIGQALGRRFRRVPVPPVDLAGFSKALAARSDALEDAVVQTLRRLYEVHSEFEPPLGPAPFLDIADYMLNGLVDGGDPAAADEGLRRELLAEGYLASLGSWLAQLEDDEFDSLAAAVGGDAELPTESWVWIKKMRKAL